MVGLGIAGRDTPLEATHHLYMDSVTVATYPDDYA